MQRKSGFARRLSVDSVVWEEPGCQTIIITSTTTSASIHELAISFQVTVISIPFVFI